MEDREKSKAIKADDIIDLTADMELTDESEAEIIDLTDIVDGPDEIAPPVTPAIETPPNTVQPAPQPARGSGFSSAIEDEVEAAFDFVQSPIREAEPDAKPAAEPEGLMDKLSDIPQMVDEALDASYTPDAEMETAADETVQPMDAVEVDSAAETDAAEPEATRSELNLDEEDDEEIIELTDIVDPDELKAADLQVEDDEEIIELTDIVDPSELEAAGSEMIEDDGIIELTDIVDPSELRVSAVIAQPDEPETGQEAAVESAGDQTADLDLEDEEFEDLLEMIDTLDAEDLLVDLADEEDQGPEFISMEEDDTPAATAEDTVPGEPGDTQLEEDQEYAQLLDTIDNLDPEDLLVSVDEAGLLESDESTEPAEGRAALEEDGLLTLMDVLKRDTDDKKDIPPAEETGTFTREVEEETGRNVRTLTDQEIEAAVERILKTKYAETIERLIANAVEKAVNREIEILKRSMLDDDAPPA
jgi:hypothetical protein